LFFVPFFIKPHGAPYCLSEDSDVSQLIDGSIAADCPVQDRVERNRQRTTFGEPPMPVTE
jgi:hypothetical protein